MNSIVNEYLTQSTCILSLLNFKTVCFKVSIPVQFVKDSLL